VICTAEDNAQTEADTPTDSALIPEGNEASTSSSKTPAPKDDTSESYIVYM
jgi:hypothetical protein